MTPEDPITFDQDPMQSWMRRCTLWGLCTLGNTELDRKQQLSDVDNAELTPLLRSLADNIYFPQKQLVL